MPSGSGYGHFCPSASVVVAGGGTIGRRSTGSSSPAAAPGYHRRWTISVIARRLNLDRKTVRRFRDTDLDELISSARDRRPNGDGCARQSGLLGACERGQDDHNAGNLALSAVSPVPPHPVSRCGFGGEVASGRPVMLRPVEVRARLSSLGQEDRDTRRPGQGGGAADVLKAAFVVPSEQQRPGER